VEELDGDTLDGRAETAPKAGGHAGNSESGSGGDEAHDSVCYDLHQQRASGDPEVEREGVRVCSSAHVMMRALCGWCLTTCRRRARRMILRLIDSRVEGFRRLDGKLDWLSLWLEELDYHYKPSSLGPPQT
jgi:hypothetical protein